MKQYKRTKIYWKQIVHFDYQRPKWLFGLPAGYTVTEDYLQFQKDEKRLFAWCREHKVNKWPAMMKAMGDSYHNLSIIAKFRMVGCPTEVVDIPKTLRLN